MSGRFARDRANHEAQEHFKKELQAFSNSIWDAWNKKAQKDLKAEYGKIEANRLAELRAHGVPDAEVEDARDDLSAACRRSSAVSMDACSIEAAAARLCVTEGDIIEFINLGMLSLTASGLVDEQSIKNVEADRAVSDRGGWRRLALRAHGLEKE